MTVLNTLSRVTHDGDGATTDFPTADGATIIYFLQNGDLKVTLIDTTTGLGVVQILDTDYTVTGAGNPLGGTVAMTVAPTATEDLLIERIVPLTQDRDFVENQNVPQQDFEDALDQNVMAIQQLSVDLIRTLKQSSLDDPVEMSIPSIALRADRVLGFDNAGLPVAGPLVADLNNLVNDLSTDDVENLSSVAGADATAALNTLLSDKLALTGGVLTGALTLAGNPTAANEAANKAYVDSIGDLKLPLGGGTLTGALTLSGDPVGTLEAAPKQYVDAGDALKLALGGGTMTGFLLLNADPTSSLHPATKQYVDNADGGKLDLSGGTMTGLITLSGAPTQGLHAATKDYIDQVAVLATAKDFKDACRVATTANITLSGTQTIDDISLAVDDRVLVMNQTTASENGIYLVKSGAWVRAVDADEDAEVTQGMYVPIVEGTSNGTKAFFLTTADPIVVDTTNLTFTVFNPGSGGGEANTAANVGTLGLGFYDGKSGVALNFRNLVGGAGVDLALDDVNNNITASLSAGGVDTAELADIGVSTAKIQAGAVTLAKMENMPANTIMGNNTGGAASPIHLTVAQTKTQLAYSSDDITNDSGVTGADVTAALDELEELTTRYASVDDNDTVVSETLALVDANSYKKWNGASAGTRTVPPNSSVAFPIGARIDGRNKHATNDLAFAQGSGVTITSKDSQKTVEAGNSYSLVKMATNTWDLIGATAA